MRDQKNQENQEGVQEVREQSLILLQSSDPAQRTAAAIALGGLKRKEALPALLAAFYDPEKEVRAQASLAVSNLGKPAVEPLIRLMHAEGWVIRYRAIEALSRIRDPAALEPLIEALSDPVDHVRYMSAKALGALGDERALDPLLSALRDENEFARRSAAIAVWKIGGKKMEAVLEDALSREESESVRETIRDILGKTSGGNKE